MGRYCVFLYFGLFGRRKVVGSFKIEWMKKIRPGKDWLSAISWPSF